MTLFGERLSVEEKINFSRHLAMVIKAGLSVYQGLTIIKSQRSSKSMKRIIDNVISDVNNGKFLADSLQRYEKIFGEFFINVIRVGEASGTLAQNLLYLAEELRKARTLKAKVRSALVYPIVILIATVGIVSFLTFFVFPKLLPIFQGLGTKLPPTTIALLATVDFIRNYGVILFFGISVFFIIIRFLMKTIKPIRYVVDLSMLYIPVVSSLTINVSAVNFTRVLSVLLRSGLRIVEALNITSNTFTNLVYKKAFIDAAEQIKKGEQLATALASQTKLFPPLVSEMIRVGENTGNLEENLVYLADFYDEEVETSLQGLTSVLEPMLLLIMGLLVGFVAISIITPIYSISQGIK
ncbi:MAG: type II secretion system F family protein [Candidatus Yanofskybacteria bacterium]|nr:type II secretion system F family protein [Candidatus Yanofskybacteria bacterium]